MRIRALDGLRGIAASSVFMVHYQQLLDVDPGQYGAFDLLQLVVNGNTGVALFFVLSGALLSLPFWGEEISVSLGRYYARRLARIVPAYYLCLTILIIENGYLQDSDRFWNVLSHYLFFFGFSDKWFDSINQPFWTIAVEMQFYLVLPLVFVLTRPLTREAALWCVGGLIVVSYSLHYGVMSNQSAVQQLFSDAGLANVRQQVLSHSLLAHLPHFLIGVLAGPLLLSSDARRSPGWVYSALFWVSAASILTLLATPLGAVLALPHGRYHFPLVPVLLAIVVVTAPRSSSAATILESPPIKYLGTISFGIYLFHLPTLKLVAQIMKSFKLPPADSLVMFTLASVVLTLAVSTISYFLLERPVLNWTAARS